MKTAAIVIARLIFAFAFKMAAAFKFEFMGMDATPADIARAGFPYPLVHGPARWAANPTEFGFFTDHSTFIAGLLFAAVHGPGARLGLIRNPIQSRRRYT